MKMDRHTHHTALARLLGFCFLASIAGGEIVDRIAVVVDRTAIKQSDVMRDLRITAFINGEKPDFGLAEQKKAANRLIDQAMIRKEIGMGRYPDPDPALVNRLLQQIRQMYRSEAAFRQALTTYGITQDELMEHLRWQEAVLQFIAVRFRSGGASESTQNDPNQPFFTWLDETRKQIRVLFKEESLK